MGHSPGGHKVSDMTEGLMLSFSFCCIFVFTCQVFNQLLCYGRSPKNFLTARNIIPRGTKGTLNGNTVMLIKFPMKLQVFHQENIPKAISLMFQS